MKGDVAVVPIETTGNKRIKIKESIFSFSLQDIHSLKISKIANIML